jgi:pyruvate,water dikinase
MRVQSGDILVVASLAVLPPAVSCHAGAIVSETGGALANPAVVARELAIPAVFGVPNATALFNDGDDVVVDGALGVVRASHWPDGSALRR